MLPLILLAHLLYSGDVTRLGDRDYPTREAAFGRLKAAGWLAAGPLYDARPGSVEAGERVGRLIDALPRVDARLIRLAGSLSPDAVECLAPPVCQWIAANGGCAPRPAGGVPCGDLWRWCQMRNYISGSVAGDFGIVVECWILKQREPRK